MIYQIANIAIISRFTQSHTLDLYVAGWQLLVMRQQQIDSTVFLPIFDLRRDGAVTLKLCYYTIVNRRMNQRIRAMGIHADKMACLCLVELPGVSILAFWIL